MSGAHRLTIILVLGLALACQGPQSPEDLRSSIVTTVTTTKARNLALTVVTDGNGFVSPGGTVQVKEGLPFTLAAQPLSTHTFEEWTVVSQEGTAVLSSPKSPTSTLTVTGGAVKVMATFTPKPEVVYITPTGNKIDRNTNVYVYFSYPVAPASVTPGSIRLLRNGTEEVGATLSVSQNFVKIDPDLDLDANINYVVRVDSSVTDVRGRGLVESRVHPFSTGATTDTTGPNSPQISVSPNLGGLHLSSSPTFLVSGMSADDSAGVAAAELQLYNNTYSAVLIPEALQSYAYNTAAASQFTLPAGSLDGKYYLGTQFIDVNGNKSSLDANTEQVLFLDTTPPVTPVLDVSGKYTSPTGKTYVPGTEVTLALTSVDDNIIDAAYNTVVSMVLAPGTSIPAAAPRQAFATAPAYTLAAGPDGPRTLTMQTYDQAGNPSPVVTSTFLVDSSPPTGSLTLAGGALATNSTTVTLGLTATDALSGEGLSSALQFSRTGPNITNTGYAAFQAAPTVTLTGGQGPKTITLRVKDPLGNAADFSTTIVYDTTPPDAPTFDFNLGATTVTGSAVTLTNLTAPDNHLVKEMAFGNASGFTPVWEPLAATKAWTLTAGNGTRTVYMRTRDHAGNVSPEASASVEVSATPPTGTVSIQAGASLTNNQAVTLTVTRSANVVSYEVSNDNVTFTSANYTAGTLAWNLAPGDGVKTVYVKLENSNTTTSLVTDTITLDKTPPTGTLVLNGGDAATPSLKPFLTLAFNDATSGIASYQVSNGTTTSASATWSTSPSASATTLTVASPLEMVAPYNAAQTFYVKVTDKAGNTSTWVSDTITLEKPIISNASKGYYPANVYVYHDLTTPGNTTNPTAYYVYSVPSATQNPNVDTTDLVSYGANTGAAKAMAVTPGTLRYFWVRAYDADSGGYGPYIGTGANPATAFGALGFATSGATIVYNSANAASTAVKDAIVGLLTNGSTFTPSAGAWTALQATVIDQSLVPTTYGYNTGPDSSIVYGDPLIVLPGTTVVGANWGSSAGTFAQAHNLVASNRGIIGMGLEGARLATVANAYWTTWNLDLPALTGYQPVDIATLYGRVADTPYYNAWSTDTTTTYYLPLGSNILAGTAPFNPTNGKTTQMSYANFGTIYTAKSTTGAAVPARQLTYLAAAYNDAGFYPITRQGRFLNYGFVFVPNRPSTGHIHFLNLVSYMRGLY